MCGHTVTFPAIPPGRAGRAGRSLRAKDPPARPAVVRKLPGALAFLRDFQYWNVVWQCTGRF